MGREFEFPVDKNNFSQPEVSGLPRNLQQELEEITNSSLLILAIVPMADKKHSHYSMNSRRRDKTSTIIQEVSRHKIYYQNLRSLAKLKVIFSFDSL